MELNTPGKWLHETYIRKREKNPRYSLRAFAFHMGIPAGRLSEIINGKRALTDSILQKMTEKLNLNNDEVGHLRNLRKRWKAMSTITKGVEALLKGEENPNYPVVIELKVDSPSGQSTVVRVQIAPKE